MGAVALGAAVGSAGVALLPTVAHRLCYAVESGKSVAARESLAKADDLSSAFKQTAKAIRPSVVSISSVKIHKPQIRPRQRRETPTPQDELFRHFFGDDPFERFFQMPDIPVRGYKSKDGVLIAEVLPNGPAAKADYSWPGNLATAHWIEA